MAQWRLSYGNQSVPIEKFLEIVGNSTSTPNTTQQAQINVNGSTSNTTVNAANTAPVNSTTANLVNSNATSSTPILIATASSATGAQNLQKNQNIPILASLAPNAILQQPQNVVIIVSILESCFVHFIIFMKLIFFDICLFVQNLILFKNF